jgi:carbon storage regulator
MMLVLSRKSGEQILIGHNVKLVVNRISGGRVSLGITAPEDVRVIRGELMRCRDLSKASPVVRPR